MEKDIEQILKYISMIFTTIFGLIPVVKKIIVIMRNIISKIRNRKGDDKDVSREGTTEVVEFEKKS